MTFKGRADLFRAHDHGEERQLHERCRSHPVTEDFECQAVGFSAAGGENHHVFVLM